MLFKWLFTCLAVLWLWLALRRYFFVSPPQEAPLPEALQPPPEPVLELGVSVQPRDDEGEYIDYEEIKE